MNTRAARGHRSSPSPHSPTSPFSTSPRRRFPIEVLSPAEVQGLLDACLPTGCSKPPASPDPLALRNRALMAVLYRAGLRIAEALALRPVDVDPASGCVRVLCGKGGRARVSGIDPGALAMVAAWLEARRHFAPGSGPGTALFCTARGRAVTAGYLRRLLPALGRQAGLSKRVHAHGLRHTHASELRAEGVDIGIISKQLGHACITTTARYLDHLNPLAVVEAMRGREWGTR